MPTFSRARHPPTSYPATPGTSSMLARGQRGALAAGHRGCARRGGGKFCALVINVHMLRQPGSRALLATDVMPDFATGRNPRVSPSPPRCSSPWHCRGEAGLCCVVKDRLHHGLHRFLMRSVL